MTVYRARFSRAWWYELALAFDRLAGTYPPRSVRARVNRAVASGCRTVGARA